MLLKEKRVPAGVAAEYASLSMLFRFSLYGFLKNQRYFEPFLVLAFLDRGCSYFLIGWLVAARELTVNLLEIPSGAMADLCGRRRAMLLSFAAYIASFLTFAFTRQIWPLFPGMLLYAVGDAFRTGTHKAIIFSWLRRQGRESERTRVYGFTRSWSKLGSALSALLAALFVIWSGSFQGVFLFATVPYVLNIFNLLSYPKELDLAPGSQASGRVLGHLSDTFRSTLKRPGLRRLMLESMGFEGTFHAVKDYLQPVLMALAILKFSDVPGILADSETRQTALLLGPVYAGLFLLSSLASRQAHRVVGWAGSEAAAARRCVWLGVAGYALMLPLAWFDWLLPVALCFVLIHALQNVWRPILIARFDAHGDEQQGATLLSIESQSRRLATLILAPTVGFLVDLVRERGPGGSFWPVAAVGLVLTSALLIRSRSLAASG